MQPCHICVLLVARRRGFVPPGSALSITQFEYECARVHRVDPLVFLLDDEEVRWPAEWDHRARDPRVAEWRGELRGRHGIPVFRADPAALGQAVAESLARWREGRGQRRDGARPSLQTPRTHFFGRGAELTELEEVLVRDGERLVTVVAPGGYGKTRLVLELAHRLNGHWPTPPIFVDLTEAVTTTELAIAVAAACGFTLERTADPAAAVGQFLADTTGLVILDNFEQLAGSDPEFPPETIDPNSPRATVDRWSLAAPGVRSRVTSRVVLHLHGERLVQVPPFPAPPEGGDDHFRRAAENPAVLLFAGPCKRIRYKGRGIRTYGDSRKDLRPKNRVL